MKNRSLIFFLSFFVSCFGAPFTDPYTGLSFEIPQGFTLDEEGSKLDQFDNTWWYEFEDSKKNVLSVEVEEYHYHTPFPEYFHKIFSEEDEENEKLIFEGLEFKNLTIGEIEFTKCKLRLLVTSEQFTEPLCFYSYLFVKDHFGFSINLMKKEDDEDPELMMNPLLQSIHFIVDKSF